MNRVYTGPIPAHYIGSYLYDCEGKTPEEAAAYLRGSMLADVVFRSYRVQLDKTFDPTTHELAPREEGVFGRVTFLLNAEGRVRRALCEYGTQAVITPWRWPPQVVQPGEVFFLGAPTFVGRMPVRKDIEVASPATPVRGWFIEKIESFFFEDRGPGLPSRTNLPPLPPPPPPKRLVRPDFLDL